MIHTGPQEGQSQGQTHRAVEVQCLGGDMTLIVVERDDRVVGPFLGQVEHCLGWDRAVNVKPLVPQVLDWKSTLAKLDGLFRQLVWVHGAFIVLVIVGFGLLSTLLAPEVTSGTPLARAVCGFRIDVTSQSLFSNSKGVDYAKLSDCCSTVALSGI